ncbi:unnamed protein product [Tetraodon nigroviridis]|uniref:(spotted green pufferfish) hypothetical protein n=1 Tax=Tetraodon nigroviridis TaxID=99883 RepID=Q4RF34_TETNG|nr:unnamed protein product [Tetraodon nigroviridis]
MNNQKQTSAVIKETERGGCTVAKEKRIIYFSSGETLEEEDSEEEEEQRSDSLFRESTQTRFSFKNLAILVGRVSLLTCDFLGERLAAALGLKAAKYQYAIDLYYHKQKTKSSQADSDRRTQTEMLQLSSGMDKTHYGTSANVTCSMDNQKSADGKRDGNKGFDNKAYQVDH